MTKSLTLYGIYYIYAFVGRLPRHKTRGPSAPGKVARPKTTSMDIDVDLPSRAGDPDAFSEDWNR